MVRPAFLLDRQEDQESGSLFALHGKPCQGLLLKSNIWYHNVLVKSMLYNSAMPRPRKNPLPALDQPRDSIGARLAQMRKAKGLTQAQIAERIGITQYLVSDYETGRLHLSDDMLIRFSKVLGTSADTILGLDEKDIAMPSLRLIKRIMKIEQLPIAKQKALLQTIDGFLRGEGML